MPKLLLEADVRTKYSQQGPRELTATGAALPLLRDAHCCGCTSFAWVSPASFALSAVAKPLPCDGGVYLTAPGYDGYGRSHEEEACPLSGLGYGLSSPVTFTPIALIPRVWGGGLASSGSVRRSSPSVSVKLFVCPSCASRLRNFIMETLPFRPRIDTMA